MGEQKRRRSSNDYARQWRFKAFPFQDETV